jgi:3-deoxy-manno-octulosonate cytidylyltransferase (CMP-KDO synthetase)
VVPARLASSRFPAKLLHPLLGGPLVVHTLNRAREAGCFSEIVCFTDAAAIRDTVAEAGFEARLIGPAANGTERIGRYADLLRHSLVVNLQGDEPAFPPRALRLLAEALRREPGTVHILVEDHPASAEHLENPNRCKAGLDASGMVLDFFRRAPRVPVREARLQFGAYAYSKEYVRRYAATAPSEREASEAHEMLRDLSLAPIQAHPCPWPGQSVDVPADLARAEELLMRFAPVSAPI